jgi:hypothetical protein
LTREASSVTLIAAPSEAKVPQEEALPSVSSPAGGGADRTTVSVVVFETPESVALIVTFFCEETGNVVTSKVADVCPCGTGRLLGETVATEVSEEASETLVEGPAGPDNVTVPAEWEPPVTRAGTTAIALRGAGVTVSVADFVNKPYVPLIVAVWFEETPTEFTGNWADVAWGGTNTLAWTVATDGLLLKRVTVVPEGPAFPVSVTVPVDCVPLGTLGGLRVSPGVASAATLTVTVAVLVTPACAAVIVTVVFEPTPSVAIGKVVELVPPGTVAVEGTVATFVLLLESETTVPLGSGALPVSVSVPTDGLPPTRLVGLIERPAVANVAGVTVSVPLVEPPPATDAAISTPVAGETPSVVTAKVFVFAAAATRTLAGTVATAVLEL